MILLDNIVFEIQKAGGISAVWSAVLNELNERHAECTVLENPTCKDNIFYQEISQAKIVEDIGNLTLRRYQDVKCKENITLFHSSYFRVHASKKIKNIVTVHDFVYEKYDKGIRKYIHLFQKKHALKRADVIICVSENTKADLLTYHPWIDNSIVRVIHNGVDKEFKPLLNTDENPRISEPPYLLYVGGRNIHKNFKAALQLLTCDESVKLSLHLKVVGGGVFSESERLLIKELKLSNRVKHYSNINNHELNHFYNNAYALIYPSFYEGFGIPPLEAMAAGCPVICSNVSSIPEVVGNAGLMFDPHTPEEAEEYLVKLQDSSFRDSVINQGLLRASQFSWEKTGRETVNLYKELL
ncbi:glycosyltransferase family 4 protein [Endozoicomonas ascidiicola]|uniref:glycosyltransferase family 4 protein n=1 Tax=Endozoicomonas ascidiicola TaxID=1698521 RepID=UPI0008343370|nr:glycosyltransferase family 1 protein [Endozoicomonas ascidiicola]